MAENTQTDNFFTRFNQRVGKGLIEIGGYDPTEEISKEEAARRRLEGFRRVALAEEQMQKAEQERARRQFALENPQYADMMKLEELGIDPRMLSPTTSETAGMKDFLFYQSLKTPEEKMAFLQATGRGSQSPELQKLLTKAKLPGGVDVTPGQKKVDEAFGKELVKWKTGEKQQAESNITNLDNKLSLLAEGRQNVSGTNIALTPDPLKPIFFPEATGFLDEVSDIVFQSLRATLGAQFTEQEGKRLIAATFNQALPEEQNIPRLQRLSAKIKAIYNSKQNAIDYYDKNGTLVGYQEEPSSFADILDSVLFDEFQRMSKEQILDKYAKANTPEERQSILRFAKMLEKQGQ
jgi:hypothetical protein